MEDYVNACVISVLLEKGLYYLLEQTHAVYNAAWVVSDSYM